MAHYIYIDGMKLRQKARAVVIDTSGNLLLVRPHGYRDGEWTLAGGGVEQGETPEEAIARELAEELGLTEWHELRRLEANNRFIYSKEHKLSRALDHDGQEAVMFLVRVDVGTPLTLQACEVADARWFASVQALRVLPVRAQSAVLETCLAEIATEESSQQAPTHESQEQTSLPQDGPRRAA